MGFAIAQPILRGLEKRLGVPLLAELPHLSSPDPQRAAHFLPPQKLILLLAGC
jgi:hypothetical protein